MHLQRRAPLCVCALQSVAMKTALYFKYIKSIRFGFNPVLQQSQPTR